MPLSPMLVDLIPFRQQISFGRNRAERWWAMWLLGHSKYLLKHGT
jgi:hypothetical protein